tara:strand:+ start:535 stop:771 length:237 start_codon:yes stop_codon:yes gene_type:complete
MKKSDRELIEILLKNVINMHEKVNIIIDVLAKDIETTIDDNAEQMKDYDDKIVDIDKSTYERMCDLLETKNISFMGIA